MGLIHWVEQIYFWILCSIQPVGLDYLGLKPSQSKLKLGLGLSLAKIFLNSFVNIPVGNIGTVLKVQEFQKSVHRSPSNSLSYYLNLTYFTSSLSQLLGFSGYFFFICIKSNELFRKITSYFTEDFRIKTSFMKESS